MELNQLGAGMVFSREVLREAESSAKARDYKVAERQFEEALRYIADRPETLELMRRHIDILAQEFRDIGYGSAEFSFGQGGQRPGG